MCLHINKAKHPIVTEKSGKQYFKPIVATEDIEVYKLLIEIVYKSGKIEYYTPYQECSIEFNTEGKWESKVFSKSDFMACVKKTPLELIPITNDDIRGCKSKNGYHAFTKESSHYNLNRDRLAAGFIFCSGKAYYRLCIFNKGVAAVRCKVFKAIIPKGSYVYYGEDGDIASNQLIIKLEIVNLNDN